MKFWKKVFLGPLALIWVLGKQLSNKLFMKGTWKSVEFEFPVISINTLVTDPAPLEVLLVVKQMIANIGLTSAIIIDREQKIKAKLSAKRKDEYAYLKPMGEGIAHVYMTNHPVLGVSELISLDDNLNCVLLGNEKFVGQIRAQARILIVNYRNPFYKSEYWPVGQLVELKSNAAFAELVVCYNVPKTEDMDQLRHELKTELGMGTQIGLIFEDELPILSGLLEHNAEEQIINIVDHDTFENSLTQIIKKDI